MEKTVKMLIWSLGIVKEYGKLPELLVLLCLLIHIETVDLKALRHAQEPKENVPI